MEKECETDIHRHRNTRMTKTTTETKTEIRRPRSQQASKDGRNGTCTGAIEQGRRVSAFVSCFWGAFGWEREGGHVHTAPTMIMMSAQPALMGKENTSGLSACVACFVSLEAFL